MMIDYTEEDIAEYIENIEKDIADIAEDMFKKKYDIKLLTELSHLINSSVFADIGI